MEIKIEDLKEEKQQEVLRELDLKSIEEGNLDIMPLFILDKGVLEDEKK